MANRSIRDTMQLRPSPIVQPKIPRVQPTVMPSAKPPAARLPTIQAGQVAPQTVGGTPPTARTQATGMQVQAQRAIAPRVVQTAPGPVGRVPMTPTRVL